MQPVVWIQDRSALYVTFEHGVSYNLTFYFVLLILHS